MNAKGPNAEAGLDAHLVVVRGANAHDPIAKATGEDGAVGRDDASGPTGNGRTGSGSPSGGPATPANGRPEGEPAEVGGPAHGRPAARGANTGNAATGADRSARSGGAESEAADGHRDGREARGRGDRWWRPRPREAGQRGFRLDLRLRVEPGETVALLGPNGAGKTTALRALAGLEPLSEGRIALDGAVLDRPRDRGRDGRGADARDLWVAPEHRRIGVVFQDYLLFPHLSALDNVAFGPRRRGMGRAEARALAADRLARVGLADFVKHRPSQLSGGQAQRVALARALATDPTLLLLDEPLAALDARTRLDTRVELHRHLAGHAGAAVLVTHDPVDALMLADRLVVIEDGRAVQEGDAESVTARPRTDYIARLVGLNLYRGRASGRTVVLESGTALATGEPLEGAAFAAFAPSAVALFREEPDGSPRNTWRASVSGVHRHGDHLRVQLDGPLRAAADVTPAAAAHLGLEPGQEVWAAVKAAEIRAYPA